MKHKITTYIIKRKHDIQIITTIPFITLEVM